MTKLSAALTLGFALLASPVNAHPSGDAAGRAVLAHVEAAWAAGDAGAIAALYAPDGDLVIPSGTRLSGRDAIGAFYRQVFRNGYAGSRADAELQATRAVAPDLLLGEGRWSIDGAVGADGAPRKREQGRFMVVLARAGADWQIAALREYVPMR